MATAASVPISARRWEACVRTIRVRGLDLTPILNASAAAGGCDLLLEVRVSDDAPGAPLVALGLTGNGNAQGLRVASVAFEAGVPVSTIVMRINEEVMEALPFQGEAGDPSVLRYGLQMTVGGLKKTRLYGDFEVVPGAVGSDAAPSSRPAWDGVTRSTSNGSMASIDLTIAAHEVIEVVLDGAAEVGEQILAASAEARKAKDEADRATAARAAAEQVAALRLIDGDDPNYVAYIVDGSDARNVLARFRRDSGAMEFVWGPALVAELAKADSALAQIAALAANVPTIAGNAAVAALAIRFADIDDTTYVAYLVDGSPDQNVLARWRRDTGALEFVYDELLAQVVQDTTTGVAGSRPSGAKLKGRFRRWGRAGGVTITDNLTSDPALTSRYTVDPANPAPFTLYGGLPVVTSGSLRIWRTPPNYAQSCGRMAFMTDAPVVQVAMNTGTLKMYRAYVDRRLESDERQKFSDGGTNVHFPKLTFSGPRARGRRVDIEIILDGAFAVDVPTVSVPPGYRIWAVDTTHRVKIAIIGDSYTDGAGSTMNALSYPYELGRMLGGLDVDVLAEGRGGTGYIAAGPGPTDNSAATGYANTHTSGDPVRLDRVAAWGPDVVVVALGTNDDGKGNAAADLKAAALYAYQQIRLRMPDVLIIVLGPWPAGSGPSDKKIAAEGYIRSAVDAFADPNTHFVPVCTSTPKSWWYGTGRWGAKKGDGTADIYMGGAVGDDSGHPGDVGHSRIAARIAAEILLILSQYTRY